VAQQPLLLHEEEEVVVDGGKSRPNPLAVDADADADADAVAASSARRIDEGFRAFRITTNATSLSSSGLPRELPLFHGYSSSLMSFSGEPVLEERLSVKKRSGV